MATPTTWWRTRTVDGGSNAIGYMTLALMGNWLMSSLADLTLNQLYTYNVTSPFLRD